MDYTDMLQQANRVLKHPQLLLLQGEGDEEKREVEMGAGVAAEQEQEVVGSYAAAYTRESRECRGQEGASSRWPAGAADNGAACRVRDGAARKQLTCSSSSKNREQKAAGGRSTKSREAGIIDSRSRRQAAVAYNAVFGTTK